MGIVLVALAIAMLVVGLLGTVIPVIPGPILSYLGFLVMFFSKRSSITPRWLWIWAGITVAVTVLDYILPAMMTKKFGGSKAATIGSVAGLFVGVFFFPPWGLILGPFLGAFTGELIHNRQNGKKALIVALGAFLAFIAGTGAKIIVCALMIFHAIRSLF
jgi:uncharacterized protein YqgC (DUF456 family)